MGKKTMLAAVAAALILSTGCTSNMTARRAAVSQPPAGSVKLNRVRSTNLHPLGNISEDVFNQAEAGNWTQAKTLCSRLGANVNTTLGAQTPAMTKALNGLTLAVNRKDKTGAQKCANEIYRELTNMSAPYNASVPTSLNSLSYYCRETVLACNRADPTGAKNNTARLIACWNSTKPAVSNIFAADKTKAQALVNTINRCQASGNLTQLKNACKAMLVQSKVIENACVSNVL